MRLASARIDLVLGFALTLGTLLLAGCDDTSEAPSSQPTLPDHPPFAMGAPKDGELTAEASVERLGRGMNMGNWLEPPIEGEWGVVMEPRHFQVVKDAGFDSVRIPVRWSTHALESAPYTIEPGFLARVDNAIAQGLGRGLAVVLDVHHYDEMYPAPAAHRERFLAIWRQLAEHYKDYPKELVFELLNEPRDKLTTSLWSEYAAEAVKIIRETNPGRTLMMGGGNWNSLGELEKTTFPKEDNVIATFHYYNPFCVTHVKSDGCKNKPAEEKTWSGTPAQKAAVDADLDRAKAWSDSSGYPLYLGEFGVHESQPMDVRAALTAHVARSAEKRGMAWAYWELVSEFKAADPTTLQWYPELKQALIPSK
jgi:endoglucanase